MYAYVCVCVCDYVYMHLQGMSTWRTKADIKLPSLLLYTLLF